MSHINYNNLSKKQTDENEKTKPQNVDDIVTNPEYSTTDDTVTNVEPQEVDGIVDGCKKLNIRKEPNLNAEVLFVVDVYTYVLVDRNASTDAWYKVYVDDAEGFCMKDYITLLQ